jgi:2-polyprenyl-3-methyl-5-hydroxy-6-metoxy-1,4-benzoquinol methylase
VKDDTKFDFIFLNDVFEHVSDPGLVLKKLSIKLKTDGKLFIDTPKQFWIYPFTKLVSKSLYTKVLIGTISTAHLQIWSKKSFELVVRESELKIRKYEESSEYTMPANFYMKNMGITNPILKLAGRAFYGSAAWIAKNKIVCVLGKRK